jgi:DNA polymerase-3 subunit alpha
MARPVAHLHTHSAHSLRDSIATVDGLVAAAAADGQPALAITDHGSLGAVWQLAEGAGEHLRGFGA